MTADVMAGSAPAASRDALIASARGVLDANWLGASTKPSPTLYPHQWNWDSGFIALGLATYRPERALAEMQTLFAAQWANGMLPHIVFNEAGLGRYFPGPDFWQVTRSAHAPRHGLTSGITQPAVHGMVLQQLLARGLDRDAIRALIPAVLALHRHLYRERDPDHLGLVYIRHPWESGNDNAPTWDIPLSRIDPSQLTIPPYTRQDLQHVDDPRERPSDRDYDRYVHLVDVARSTGYDEARTRDLIPFRVIDPLFNALLAWSSEALVELCTHFGLDAAEPQDWVAAAHAGLEGRLWNEHLGRYDAIDCVSGERMPMVAISSLLPIITGAPSPDRVRRIVETLQGPDFSGTENDRLWPYPSVARSAPMFDPHLYWRGPTWMNTSWLAWHGLRRHGYHAEAGQLRSAMLDMVQQRGFHEYFHPLVALPDGVRGGYGTGGFSWTAALVLDLLTPMPDTAA
ncbi:MAG: hypothetical protein K2R93_08955 [Gemmatimonadaceae bacterium]|nr:hypothetical protein [Gemmatimonadaceae bacterium]